MQILDANCLVMEKEACTKFYIPSVKFFKMYQDITDQLFYELIAAYKNNPVAWYSIPEMEEIISNWAEISLPHVFLQFGGDSVPRLCCNDTVVEIGVSEWQYDGGVQLSGEAFAKLLDLVRGAQ